MTDGPQREVETLNRFQRQLTRKAFGASVLISVVLFALGYKTVSRGLLLGSLFSVVNFVLMTYALPRQVGYGRRKATGFAMISILLRFALLALPLLIAFKLPMFNWIAVTAGLFAVPLAIYIDKVFLQRLFANRVHP
jgi:ATP synthase protein I